MRLSPEQQIADLKANLDTIRAGLSPRGGVDLDAARRRYQAGEFDLDSDEPNAYILARLFEGEQDLAELEAAHTEGLLEGYDTDDIPL